MNKILMAPVLFAITVLACNNDIPKAVEPAAVGMQEKIIPSTGGRHFTGTFSNGMKGNTISFDISADGTKVENFIFQGHWHCSNKLEKITAGPDGAFPIEKNKVNSHISEPPNGGSTAWRFDLSADFDGKKATGTFRMNINNLGCNTGTLHWTATAK